MAARLSGYLNFYIAKRSNNPGPLKSDYSGEDDECLFNQEEFGKGKQRGKKRSRIGISEEVFGIFNKPESTEFRNIPKTEEARSLIKGLIRESILFTNLAEK